MRRILVSLSLLLSVTLFAVACTGDEPVASPSDNTPATVDDGEVVINIEGNEIVLASGLSGFDSCDALLDHLRTEAAERVTPWGFDTHGWFGPVFARDGMAVDESMDDDAGFDMAESSAASTDGGSAIPVEGVDFSGTNVQEIGVDEADIIKTDGDRVFVIAAGQLIVVDASARDVVGTLDLPNDIWQGELFLAGDDLLLISSGWRGNNALDGATTSSVEGVDSDAEFDDDIAIEEDWYGATDIVRIARIQLDGDRPELISEMFVEGDYVSSRAIDGTARVIVRSNPQYNFPFVYPQSEKGEEIAENANRVAVLDSNLDTWLPAYGIVDASGATTETGLLPNCGAVHAPTEFSGFGVLSVINVDVTGDIADHTTTSVLAPGNTVYASTESVYVATQTWADISLFDNEQDAWQQAWDARRTSIHRFALSGDDAAYVASGSVAGDIRNQFNLSEYDGHLRVVTTTGETWDETSETHIRVLSEDAGELVEIGSVGDMGRGEAVQSVRMIGDVGYVVTFRQIDPFYTLDLSDPENPRVVGELKIPGFSSYLHPIGEDRVLGVGSDGTDDGRITGSKVSIFDVSDPANPEEVAIWSAPGGWNDVGWEHRSFLWWEAEQMAVVPLTTYDEDGHWAGAIVLRVDGTDITEVGRIDHADPDADRGVNGCRRITGDDISGFDPNDEQSFESELEWIIAFDEEGQIRLCEDGEKPSATGFDCYDEPWLLDEAERMEIPVSDGATIWMCWPGWNQMPTIVRTIVLDGDELWTLGTEWGYASPDAPGTLQINDLKDLGRLDRVTLN
ncbi:MAG: beta-propeller domain-containing protein [Acidimicrobiales bacterium]|nr:beta-propeller domain-containing protein [Acidimicrobiales bacterium]